MGCAGALKSGYESAADAMQQGDATDPGEAQAEADYACQVKHVVSQRVEGETIYNCAGND